MARSTVFSGRHVNNRFEENVWQAPPFDLLLRKIKWCISSIPNNYALRNRCLSVARVLESSFIYRKSIWVLIGKLQYSQEVFFWFHSRRYAKSHLKVSFAQVQLHTWIERGGVICSEVFQSLASPCFGNEHAMHTAYNGTLHS